jgi:hypothetical protein
MTLKFKLKTFLWNNDPLKEDLFLNGKTTNLEYQLMHFLTAHRGSVITT